MYQQSKLGDWGNDPRYKPRASAGTKNTLTLNRHSSFYLRSRSATNHYPFITLLLVLHSGSSQAKAAAPSSPHMHTHKRTHTKNTHSLTLTPLSLPAKWATLLLRIPLTKVWSVSLGHHIFLRSRTFVLLNRSQPYWHLNVYLFYKHKVNSYMKWTQHPHPNPAAQSSEHFDQSARETERSCDWTHTHKRT